MTTTDLPTDNVILAELVEPPTLAQPRPWGFWATLGLSLAVVAVFFAVTTLVVIGFVITHPAVLNLPGSRGIEELAASGLVLSVAELYAAPISIAVIVLLVKLRHQLSVRDYLCLHRVPVKRLLGWTAILLVFLAAAEWTSELLSIGTSDVVVRAYRTAEIVPLFWAAIVVAAPLFEEIFFRGFIFRGIQQSRLGNTGAVLITALAWALLHIHYDPYQLGVILAGGILLGTARAQSNSTYLTIALHTVWNTVAMVQIGFYVP